MSADLDDTLNELGEDYRVLVEKLRSSSASKRVRRRRVFSSRQIKTIAAVLFASVAIGVSVFVKSGKEMSTRRGGGSIAASTVPSNPYARLLCIAHKQIVSEIIRTQNSDGSWQSDYLTRQNAAALRLSGECGVSYRKAVRYLRQKGLEPLTDEEFHTCQALAASKGRVCYAVKSKSGLNAGAMLW